ncbi:MAG: TIGR03364 family FAD-dependent oxidoreductase [Planctomycetales bacterium]|nr:TIGR03364 family FAD-dependent oxidoreductase [Planctomycetales bacterium]
MSTIHRTDSTEWNGRARPLVVVVGAGIVGIAQAWAAARRGCRVVVLERDARARGASIRNFGMVWPIGQSNGPAYRAALRSRALWQELIEQSGVWGSRCGSLHLAYREDELAVLSEFARLAPALGYDCQLLTPEAVQELSPAARRPGLLGALSSRTEMCVDPREVIQNAPTWLAETYDVQFRYGAKVQSLYNGRVTVADGEHILADQVIVAAGADLRDFYPELYRHAGFQRCKLQMLRTAPQPAGWRLGPMLAGGLTLRHYAAFGICRTLSALKERIEAETPELNRFGIHVMASQNGLGEVILGDSHEYHDDASPFDKAEIDELMLRELRKMIELPDWTIRERWHGVYVKAPDTIQLDAQPEPGVRVAIASGGAGMTMSFGLADEYWEREMGPPLSPTPSAAHSPQHIANGAAFDGAATS